MIGHIDLIPTTTPALFFGVVFDLILFGILTTQVYIYYISFPKDRILLKIAVVWVYLAGVAQTGLAILDLRLSLTRSLHSFKKGSPISGTDHLWLSITALTGAVAIVIQSLYAHRIYVISKKRWLVIMVVCMSLCQFASSIYGAFCYRREQIISSAAVIWRVVPPTCKAGFTFLWGPINIVCDLTITVCMVTFLLKHRKRTMRQQTRSQITKIVQIVVETGMATTILMIIYTVLFALGDSPLTNGPYPYFPGPGLMMSKVYSNSMLALLNNRATIVNGRNTMESFEFGEVSARDLEGDIQFRPRDEKSTAT